MAIDSAVINTRIFNDDPTSTLTTTNSYPALVEISDTPTGAGYANLHNFHLADAGVEHPFANSEAFSFSADLTISGAGEAEAGLQIAPWWSQNVDGRLNFRTTDGEIAAFGGRLPFYSFTGSQGLTYTKGDTVRVGVVYSPHSLSMADPATIVYNVTLGATDYTSGPLAFDQGNPAEGYGTWGNLDDARVGGYMQVFTDERERQQRDGNLGEYEFWCSRAGDVVPRWSIASWVGWHPPTEQLSWDWGPRHYRPPASLGQQCSAIIRDTGRIGPVSRFRIMT